MKEIRFYSCADIGCCLVDFGESSSQCRAAGLVLMEPNSTEAATDKHVPVSKLHKGSLAVTVGEILHPMQPEHCIEWIYLHTTLGGAHRRLYPGDQPRAIFPLQRDEEVLGVYAYCNQHGLWRAEARSKQGQRQAGFAFQDAASAADYPDAVPD